MQGGTGHAPAPEVRFAFGENWSRFLRVVDEDRSAGARASIERALGAGVVEGASFLDPGCGSGLFSLAAERLGGARVHSFDLDPTATPARRS